MYILFDSITQFPTLYLSENLTCMSYGLDLLIQELSLLVSYTSLLLDISEIFGVWLVVSILLLLALSSMIVIHRTSNVVLSDLNSKSLSSNGAVSNYKNFVNAIISQTK